jgi:hypothetical protein
MTIEQTVDIPANRRIFLDLPLAPVGKAHIAVTITPESARPAAESADNGGPSGWVNPLWGRARARGSKLTLERFTETQREDIELENELDNRLWGGEK